MYLNIKVTKVRFVAKIIKRVLIALYEGMGASLVFAFMFMFVFMAVQKYGLKDAMREWINEWKKSSRFRQVFFFALYVAMILFRTVFCRSVWDTPVINVLGVWGLYDSEGKLYTQNIENMFLFVPFTILFMCMLKSWKCEEIKHMKGLVVGTCIAFLFSLSIEFMQLFLKLGTFQLSDLFFNTLGGSVGVLMFVMVDYVVKKAKNA